MQAGFLLKIEHAELRAKEVLATFEKWKNSAYVTSIHDGVGSVQLMQELPAGLGIQVGEVFQHLRSALDLIVYQIAEKYLSSEMLAAKSRELYFPVPDKSDVKASNKSLACLPDAAKAAIISLIPKIGDAGFDSHPLIRLHRMNNADKHRFVLSTLCRKGPTRLQIGEGYVKSLRTFPFKNPEFGGPPVPFMECSPKNYGSQKVSIIVSLNVRMEGADCAAPAIDVNRFCAETISYIKAKVLPALTPYW